MLDLKEKTKTAQTQKSQFSQMEEKILDFWEKNKIFQKSMEHHPKSKEFVFFEGPPTANGRPGIHHVLARSYKDIICRYKTMRGFRVERKAGWDTHGLPVELQVEKELKISSKREIEKFGIEEFNKKCKESVWYYKDEWERLTKRIAFWVDLEHPYITYGNEYIESVWWILSEIHRKGLLYEGYKVVPYCSRCGTGLSSHEVAQGYKKIKDNSIYIRFKVNSADPEWANTSFLVWTTTPWTLPGNVALAVNPKIKYVCIPDPDKDGNWLVLGHDNFNKLLEKNFFPEKYGNLLANQLDIFLGSEILGTEYEQLFDFVKPDKPAFKVVAGDFVTTQDGSGVVHIAPAFGADDMNAAQENDLPILITADAEGKFIDKISPWAGKFVTRAEINAEIIEELKKRGVLFGEEIVEHDYPFCWRCGTKLIYYAKQSWFIRMTEPKIKKALVKNNGKINWIPEYIKEGRFGEWLRDVKDWALSRERYWGTPLPVWKCQTGQNQKPKTKNQNCGNTVIIGSIAELEKLSGAKLNDLHRPYIDGIVFKCDKCGGDMRRVSDVIDCWFDSGAMPFAQRHWPFAQNQKPPNNKFTGQAKNKKQKLSPPELFPADYISEAIDQTRGWFYTLLAISTLLDFGPPYKNVITYGHILDAKGQKMSKSKGNVVDPWLVADKYGIDILRWYFYTVGAPGEPKRFDFKDMDEIRNKFFRAYRNSFLFLQTYKKDRGPRTADYKLTNVLDKWIVSRLNETILEATEFLDNYDVTHSARLIADFVGDLSNWYIRRSRDRVRKQDIQAVQTLRLVLGQLAKLTAPFIPFVSEEIYRQLFARGKEAKDAFVDLEQSDREPKSVHLCDWPKANKKLINGKLNRQMKQARRIVNLSLAIRAKGGIKVRQPLSCLAVNDQKLKSSKKLLDLIKDEINIKEINFVKEIKPDKDWILESEGSLAVALNTRITEALKEEGTIREIIRQIQEMRKAAKYTIKDLAVMHYNTDSRSARDIIEREQDSIRRKTILSVIEFKSALNGAQYNIRKKIKLDDIQIEIGLKK